MLKRLHFDDRESWLAGRSAQGIGGSEAAAAIGLSPWMTPLELWRLKTGQTQPKDLSGNAAVEQGVKWEPILRDLFAATHPEHQIEHYPYDMLYQTERPWLFATLDGELYEGYKHEFDSMYDGEYRPQRKGILEIKTATPTGKAGWAEWSDGKMKPSYYVQCLHQLLATGYDFVRLFACLFSMDGSYTIKEYEIERSDVQEDLDWLLAEETKFWGYVQRREMPPMPLML